LAEECVAIASSIDTILPAMVSREMRDRWLRALRQAMRAVGLVEERLGEDPTAEAFATRA
jgi:truncated hemoglobin YjbI